MEMTNLFTAHCLLFTVHCLLFTVYCSLFTVHGSLFIAPLNQPALCALASWQETILLCSLREMTKSSVLYNLFILTQITVSTTDRTTLQIRVETTLHFEVVQSNGFHRGI